MRTRVIGGLLTALSVLPVYNLGLPAYAIPFNPSTRVFHADGHGDSCAERLGWPVVAGIYGNCAGYLTDRPLPAGTQQEKRTAYRTTGERVRADGPDQYAGATWRTLGMPATPQVVPAVRTVGITGSRVAQRPAALNLAIGVIAPWSLLAGLLLSTVALRQPRTTTAARRPE